MFAQSLTVCEILAKLIKCQKFDLQNEGQGQGQGGENETCNIRLKISDSM